MANKYVCVDVYTVRAGDTLYSIAQRYNVDVGLLMRVNQVRNPYNLRIGTRLCIPGLAQDNNGGMNPDSGGGMQPGMNPGMQPDMNPNMPGMQPDMNPNMPGMQPDMNPNMPGMQPGMRPDSPSVPAPLPDVTPDESENTPAPRCRVMHTVQSGDTLYMIAKTYKVTLDALMNANPNIDPYNMQIGAQLCIPR